MYEVQCTIFEGRQGYHNNSHLTTTTTTTDNSQLITLDQSPNSLQRIFNILQFEWIKIKFIQRLQI